MQTLNENIPKKIIRFRKDSTILDKGSESVNEMYFLEFYNNPLRQDVRYEAKLSSENIDIFRALSHQQFVQPIK